MFRGKAQLKSPEDQSVVATLTEDGDKIRVVLKQPVTLSGTTRLAIYGTAKDVEIISAVAAGGQDTELREFHGVSSLGVLADRSDLSLTRSPGGELSTLLIVLGRGELAREEH